MMKAPSVRSRSRSREGHSQLSRCRRMDHPADGDDQRVSVTVRDEAGRKAYIGTLTFTDLGWTSRPRRSCSAHTLVRSDALPPREQIGAGAARTIGGSATIRPYPAGMSDLPPAVPSERDQIGRLSEHASPCRYLLPAKWAAMRQNALALLDEHGAEAHRLG